MKKSLLLLFFTVAFASVRSQCVISCSNYAVSSISFSQFPTGGTDVSNSFIPNKDDGSTGAVPIGFTFNFYCNNYTDVYICSNGFMQFNSVSWAHGTGVHPASGIPSTSEPNNQVAFNSCDLDPNGGGTITYTTIGTSPNRMFIVSYNGVPNYGQTSLNTGQIVLYETSNIIEIHTTAAAGTTAQAQSGTGTQGIENQSGTFGVPVPGRSNSAWYPGTNTAYRFERTTYTPMAPALIMGDSVICQGTSTTFSINSIPTATAYNWSAPSGWQGSSFLNSASYTVPSTGIVSVSATYSCGTSPVKTIFVTIIPGPSIFVNASPKIICSGTPITFTVSGADTYTLDPGNQTSLPFTDVPTASTTYSVVGTNTDGCVSSQAATVFITVNTTPTVTVNSGAVCPGTQFNFVVSGAQSYSYQTPFPSVTETVPGFYSYTVVGTSSSGCKSAPATSSLLVHPHPTITAVATKSLICKGNTTTLTAGGGTAYVWTHTTSTSNTLIVNPVVSNNYSVNGTDANGCVGGSNLVTVTVSACAAVSEYEMAPDLFNVYPNPSNDKYTIESKESISFIIYDVTGKLVRTGNVTANEKTEVAHDLPPGQYLFRATAGNAQRSLILIKN